LRARRRWALGVLIYEMVAGYPPFYHEDRVQMFKNICHVKFSFPSSFGKAREGRAAPALPAKRRERVCDAAAQGCTCQTCADERLRSKVAADCAKVIVLDMRPHAGVLSSGVCLC